MATWPTSVATDAILYIAVNNLQTTLSGSIDNAVTTLTLASSTGFPTAGGVTIDTEVIFYTGISGAQLTGLTRGADGTTAASHSSGVPVGATVIAAHHNLLKNEIIAIESSLNLTASKAVATNSNGRLVASSVTDTELGYLSGVTSAIQTQINGKVSSASPTFTGIVSFPTGSQGAPSFTFTGDTDTGIFSSGANTINLTTNGTSKVSLDTVSLTTNLPVYFADGAVGTPSLTFSADTDTGIYRPGANIFEIVCGGANALGITTSVIQVEASHVLTVPDGTVSVPAYSFNNDTDTGFYRIGSNDLGLACGATKVAEFKTTGVSLQGTTTNDDAAGGTYGERVSSTITTLTNFPSTGTYGDLTSISLTAGDWDVSAFILANANGATTTAISCGISTTSGNSQTGLQQGDNWVENNVGPVSGATQSSASIPVYRMSLSTTTTVYFKYEASFSVATPKAEGRISARRVR